MKKVLKVIAIIAAIAAAIAGICVICKKLLAKKDEASEEENYVSCSCEEEFTAETVAEDAAKEAAPEETAE